MPSGTQHAACSVHIAVHTLCRLHNAMLAYVSSRYVKHAGQLGATMAKQQVVLASLCVKPQDSQLWCHLLLTLVSSTNNVSCLC